MKRPSEALFGKALREVDLRHYVYRLPDPKTGEGVSNWKPCDFMVWWEGDGRFGKHTDSAWFEVKDTPAVNSFPFADMRPSQVAGIAEASRIGIPYFLAIYWRRAGRWTISDAARVMAWREDMALERERPETSIPRDLLTARFGVDAAPRDLSQVLKAAMLGELR